MISVNVVGINEVRASFKRMRDRTSQPMTAMEIIAAKGWKDVIDHFSEEKSDFGSWPSLKRPRPSGGNKILQDTGRLRMSNRWRTVGSEEAHVFNQVEYAAVHNYGSQKKNIPQRKFLWLSDSARVSVQRTILRWIAEGKAN